MEDREIIQQGLDYIEETLASEITAAELAVIAGFSMYHYYRIFQQHTGFPVMRYIQRRRLLHGIYAIAQGSTKTDAALRFGFDTYPGFYKAFCREFGCSPSEYLRSLRAKRPYRIDLAKEVQITVTTKKAARILVNWGLENEPVSDVWYEGTGNRNDSALYVGENHVLKFTPDLGKLKTNIQLSEACHRRGLMAAVPVRTLEGADYIRDGSLYYYVTRRLPGKQLTAEAMYQGSAFSVGEAIGRLHQALAEVEACVNEADLMETVMNWALPKSVETLGEKGNGCEALMAELGALYPRLPRQIIHRDPNPGNILSDGTDLGFIDFELSERNIRIFDICYAATAMLSESFAKDNGQWPELLRDIIRGYDSVAGLSEEERRAIPYVILANQLICVAWFGEQEKYAELLEINKKMTLWLIGNFEKLQKSAS